MCQMILADLRIEKNWIVCKYLNSNEPKESEPIGKVDILCLRISRWDARKLYIATGEDRKRECWPVAR